MNGRDFQPTVFERRSKGRLLDILPPNAQNKWTILVSAFLLLMAFGYVDFITGPEIFFSFFYLVPIAMISWYFGLVPGFYFSFLCAAVGFLADLEFDHGRLGDSVLYWNSGIRVGFFLVYSLMMNFIRKELFAEYLNARLDPLTNVYNSRAFLEMFDGGGLDRKVVPPLTIAFMDVDDFKKVNDRFGHEMGDVLLRTAARVMRNAIRPSDVIARLGGDEFIIAFPATDSATARKIILELRRQLKEALGRVRIPATLSIGAVTLPILPVNMLEVIRIADQLMYDVKKKGKNAYKIKVLPKPEV